MKNSIIPAAFVVLEACAGAPNTRETQPIAPVSAPAPRPIEIVKGRVDAVLNACPAPVGIDPTISITNGDTFARGKCRGERTEHGKERHTKIVSPAGAMDISMGTESDNFVYLLSLNDGRTLVDADTGEPKCNVTVDGITSTEEMNRCTELIIGAQTEATDRF